MALKRRCAKGKSAGCRNWQPCPVHPTSNWENNQSPPLPSNWGQLVRDVLSRDKACRSCGRAGKLEVDHIIPRAAGGSNDLGNLQALCAGCHDLKTRADKKKYRHG